MKIVYIHHAERDISSNNIDKSLDNITSRGRKITKLFSDRIKDLDVTAIYSSPYLRCMETAKIINERFNLDIIKEDRFNEYGRGETWEEVLKRNIDAIDDIYNKYEDNDTILCITSGVNITAFICYFYNIKPSNDLPFSQAGCLSPVIFNKNK